MAEVTLDWREDRPHWVDAYQVRRKLYIAREVSGWRTRFGADGRLYVFLGRSEYMIASLIRRRQFRTTRSTMPPTKAWRDSRGRQRRAYKVRSFDRVRGAA